MYTRTIFEIRNSSLVHTNDLVLFTQNKFYAMIIVNLDDFNDYVVILVNFSLTNHYFSIYREALERDNKPALQWH